MLAIRMQRTGRSGNAQFRLVVQEARRTPTSGNVVALLGNYDPHTKTQSLDKDKAAFYLEHGAQPSSRAVRLLQAEGVKLPKWVATQASKQSKLRNPAKLRRNQPKEAAAPAVPEAPAEPQLDAEATEQA
jgi:small subunit ribosomal protein S16